MSNTRDTHDADARIAEVTVRRATAADDTALSRLAQLDSSQAPANPVLVAEADGRVRAAISIADGTVIADPFHPSAELVAILRMRAGLEPSPRPSRLAALWERRPQPAPRPTAPSAPGIPVVPSHTH